MVESPRTARRDNLGTISFSSSNRFPFISAERADKPVMFPPGLAREGTKPLPTGSLSCPITMGIVRVAQKAHSLNLLRRLRLCGKAKRKENSDENETENFLIHCFTLAPRAYRLTAASLDHFVCQCEHVRRNHQANLFGRLEIDNEFKLCCLLDGKIGGLCALQDFVHVNSCTPVTLSIVGCIGHETTGLYVPSVLVH